MEKITPGEIDYYIEDSLIEHLLREIVKNQNEIMDWIHEQKKKE